MSTLPGGTSNTKLLVFTLVFFILACTPSVLKRSIWTDEAWSMLVLSGRMIIGHPTGVTTPEYVQKTLQSQGTLAQTLHTLIRDDVHPPVYFLLAKVWSWVFGQSLSSLRWMSVLTGLATICLFFGFLNLHSTRLAVIATPLFAFSTGVLHYSTETRHYITSLLGLVTILYLMARISNARNDSGQTKAFLMAALIAATALTFLTNYLAIFPIAACYLWFVAAPSNWRTGIRCGLISLLFMSMWLPFLFEHRPEAVAQASGFDALSQELYSFDFHPQGHEQEIGWQGLPRQMFLLLQGTLGSLYIASLVDYPTSLHWIGRLFLVGLIILAAASPIVRPEASRLDSLTWLFVLLALAPAAGVIIIYVLVSKQLYGLRYMMLAAPGLAALVALGILRIHQFNFKLGAVAWGASLFLLLSVANWGYAASYYQGNTIYREFARLVQRQPRDSSLVIAGTGAMGGNTVALLYELPSDTHVLVLRPETDVSSILAATEPYDHVWLVRVRELTRDVEAELAASLQRSHKIHDVFHQIEHYEKSKFAQNSPRK